MGEIQPFGQQGGNGVEKTTGVKTSPTTPSKEAHLQESDASNALEQATVQAVRIGKQAAKLLSFDTPERAVEKELKKLVGMNELERLVELQDWTDRLNRHLEGPDGKVKYFYSDDFLYEMIKHINERLAILKTKEKLGIATDKDRQERSLLQRMHKAIVRAQDDRIELRERREAERAVDDAFEKMKEMDAEDQEVELTDWTSRLNEREPIPPCHPSYRYSEEQLDMMLKHIEERLQSEPLSDAEQALLKKMKAAILVAKELREKEAPHFPFPFPHVIAEVKGA